MLLLLRYSKLPVGGYTGIVRVLLVIIYKGAGGALPGISLEPHRQTLD